ncbi:DUF5134 domain-containing protein [Streptomyces sp. NPDC101225]|uniref:DUF5134 domain-containing protein n=1 Tax=Streptomyces sp. NPDC101225 TaxID=3366135 RepID=UPI0038150D59
MASMVSAMDASGTVSAASGSGGASDMVGMDMAGDSGLSSMSLSGTGPTTAAVLPAIVLGVLGLFWLTRALDRARAGDGAGRGAENGHRVTSAGSAGAPAPACRAARALGMAVMFVVASRPRWATGRESPPMRCFPGLRVGRKRWSRPGPKRGGRDGTRGSGG